MLATSAAAPPSLIQQVGMAGTAAVITVTFIHPIDVVKVSFESDGSVMDFSNDQLNDWFEKLMGES